MSEDSANQAVRGGGEGVALTEAAQIPTDRGH